MPIPSSFVVQFLTTLAALPVIVVLVIFTLRRICFTSTIFLPPRQLPSSPPDPARARPDVLILAPCRDEQAVISDLCRALDHLDYPRDHYGPPTPARRRQTRRALFRRSPRCRRHGPPTAGERALKPERIPFDRGESGSPDDHDARQRPAETWIASRGWARVCSPVLLF